MHANALSRGLLVSALVVTSSCAPAVDEPKKEADDPVVVPEVCTYPTPTALEGVGSVIAPIGWNVAMDNLGETSSLNLEDVYCREAPFEDVETIFFVLVAEWCRFCPDYSKQVGELTPALEARKAMVVFVDMERTDASLPTTEDAEAYVNHYTENAWRVGEADGVVPGSIHSSAPIWPFLPGLFVVRTRDMKVIASRAESDVELPLLDIAENPDGDWATPPPAFAPNCTEAEDEVGEPNDVIGDATALSAGAPLSGGICTEAPDFYTIDLAGSWRVDVSFSNAEGDLDLYVVDPVSGEPISEGGEPVGGFTTEDVETVTRSGPGAIAIVGYNRASAGYEIELTDLSEAP